MLLLLNRVPASVIRMLFPFRDTFIASTDALESGISTPGPGNRLVTDTHDTLFIESNAIRRHPTGSDLGVLNPFPFGEVGISWTDINGDGFNRIAGRSLMVAFTSSDREEDVIIGWSPISTAGDHSDIGHHFVIDEGRLGLSMGDAYMLINDDQRTIRPMEYLCIVVLQDQGAYYLLSTFADDYGQGMSGPLGIPAFPQARLVGLEMMATDPVMFPNIQFSNDLSYGDGSIVQDVRIVDLEEPSWITPFGISAVAESFSIPGPVPEGWTVNSGDWSVTEDGLQLQQAVGFDVIWHPAQADGIFQWDFTLPTTPAQPDGEPPLLPFFGFIFRRTGVGTYLRLIVDGSQTLRLQSFTSGAYEDTLLQAFYPWQPGQRYLVTVYAQDEFYHIFIDDERFTGTWFEDVHHYHEDGTGAGFMGADMGVNAGHPVLHRFAVTPHYHALPEALQRGIVPTQWQPTETIYSESFIGVDGTSLTESGWTISDGTAQITDNRAQLTLGSDDSIFVVRNIDTDAYELSVDIHCAATPTDYVSAGVVIDYFNPQTWVVIRPTIDKDFQTEADEIEKVRSIDGIAHVVGKVQMNGLVWIPNATHRLTVQVGPHPTMIGRRKIQVFLDGYARMTYVCDIDQPSSTWCGFYRNEIDDGTTFSNLTIRAIEQV